MTDQTVLYLLAALGWIGVLYTRYRMRDTTPEEWIKENGAGIISSFIAVATFLLIGPGDDVELGSYVARSWAAGLGGGVGYLISGNVRSAKTMARKMSSRTQEKLNLALGKKGKE